MTMAPLLILHIQSPTVVISIEDAIAVHRIHQQGGDDTAMV